MLDGKRILGVTLARGGSKSIPKKNIIPLLGKPLISYTIEEALKSKYLDAYIVSTDCEQIRDVAMGLGAEVPFLRPKKYSEDNSSSADALIHALNYMEQDGQCFDYIVELMATNPLKVVEDIDSMIETTVTNKEISCVAVHKLIEHHPSRIKYIENGYLRSFYPEIPESRRQDLTPSAYIRSGSIYITDATYLKKNKSRYSSETTRAYILPDERVANLDEPDDLKLLESKLS